MVELYAEGIKKSIRELELDEELRKFAEKHLGKMLKAFSTIPRVREDRPGFAAVATFRML
jgi:hypothetical protein